MTNHDELCEKVIRKADVPEFSSDDMDREMGYGENRGWNNAREALLKALTSGLLCDGKELEEAKKSAEDNRKLCLEKHALLLKQQKELSSIKLKLSEAEKEIDAVKENAIKLLHTNTCDKHSEEIRNMPFREFLAKSNAIGCDFCLQEKLSGSCEGMTVESLEEIIKNWRSPQGGKFTPYFCKYAAKSIHAHMTGGKK